MESEKQVHQWLQECREMLRNYHTVLADGLIVYQGYNPACWWAAFVAAGKSGAAYVSHQINGVEVTRSFSVRSTDFCSLMLCN